MSMHAVTEKDISKEDWMDIGQDGRRLYCRILATGHSMRIGFGRSISIKCAKNLKRS